jgi:hypothetical protein
MRQPETTYRASFLPWGPMLAVLVLFTGVGLWMVTRLMRGEGDAFWIVWLGFVAFFWWNALRVSYAVRVDAEGTFHFRGLVRRVSIPAREIRVVRRSRLAGDQEVVVEHLHGQVRLLQPIGRFYDFLKRLEALNPTVEIAV